MMNEFPGKDLTDKEMDVRLGHNPAHQVQIEGVRINAICREMRDKRGQYQVALYDVQLLDHWRDACRRRMINQGAAGQLREMLRFERQLEDLACGEYGRRRDAAQEASNAADRERYHREAPGVLLAKLRAEGKPLALDKQGHITAPPGAGLHLNEIEAVKQHREALVALLRSEAEAARPVVIA